MQHVIKVCVVGVAVVGCAPLDIYYRPGVSVTRMQTDVTRCDVQALKDAPVANQIRERAPVYFPGAQYCSAGTCVRRPGYWVSGGFYTVDVNQDLRSRVQALCMAQKGYEPVTLPRCSPAIANQVPQTPTTILPTISPASCAIRYDDGGWQIVTPVSAQ